MINKAKHAERQASEMAREDISRMSCIFDIAGAIGSFADDYPDTQFQLEYLRTLTNEFQKRIAVWKLDDSELLT